MPSGTCPMLQLALHPARHSPPPLLARRSTNREAGASTPTPGIPRQGPKTANDPLEAGRLPGGGVAVLLWEVVPYLVQLVDQELRLQLDRVGSMDPLEVLEQAQLQLDRLQEDRLHDERLQEDRLQLDRG